MTIFLLNSGHGMDTAGKRSKLVPPGIKEWDFNVNVATRIIGYASSLGVDVFHLDKEFTAVPLAEIVRRASEHYDKKCIFISIHANALENGENDDDGWNMKASGCTVLLSNMASPTSVNFARMLSPRIATLGKFKNRGIKHRSLYVLDKTACPAVLSENGFMTHPDDATKLASPYWQDKIALAHVDAMVNWVRFHG